MGETYAKKITMLEHSYRAKKLSRPAFIENTGTLLRAREHLNYFSDGAPLYECFFKAKLGEFYNDDRLETLMNTEKGNLFRMFIPLPKDEFRVIKSLVQTPNNFTLPFPKAIEDKIDEIYLLDDYELTSESYKSLLLEGPSGSGKTTLAHRIASKLGRGLISLTINELFNPHQGGVELFLQTLFKYCESETSKKVVVLFEDLDVLVGNFNSSLVGIGALAVRSALVRLLTSRLTNRVFIIATTNNKKNIPFQILSRVRPIIRIPMLDEEGARQLFENNFPNFDYDVIFKRDCIGVMISLFEDLRLSVVESILATKTYSRGKGTSVANLNNITPPEEGYVPDPAGTIPIEDPTSMINEIVLPPHYLIKLAIK